MDRFCNAAMTEGWLSDATCQVLIVPRYFRWASQILASRQQIDHDDKVACGAVAAGACFSRFAPGC